MLYTCLMWYHSKVLCVPRVGNQQAMLSVYLVPVESLPNMRFPTTYTYTYTYTTQTHTRARVIALYCTPYLQRTEPPSSRVGSLPIHRAAAHSQWWRRRASRPRTPPRAVGE